LLFLLSLGSMRTYEQGIVAIPEKFDKLIISKTAVVNACNLDMESLPDTIYKIHWLYLVSDMECDSSRPSYCMQVQQISDQKISQT
jgi:hypothetical protein